MPISGPKNRTIRRKLGPNKKPLPGSETTTGEISGGGINMPPPPGGGDDPVPPITPPTEGGDDPVPPTTPPTGGGDDPVPPTAPPVEGGDDPVPPTAPPVEGGDDPVPPTAPPVEGGDDPVPPITPPIGGYGIGGGKEYPSVQVIEKTFHHKYTPERSKWWWVKYLCCLLVVGLLVWVLWCLYSGCPCRNVTIDQTKTVYVEHGTTLGKNINNVPLVKVTDINKTNQTRIGMENNSTMGRVQNSDNNGSINTEINTSTSQVKPIAAGTSENNRSKIGGNTPSSKSNALKETSKMSKKERHEEKIKHLEGLFKARMLPDNVEPALKSVEKGSVGYVSVDGKSYKESVDSFKVVPYEVTIKDYFYFANGNLGNYPEFWDNSENDVRKNIASKYQRSCLEEECPIIGISPKNAESYVKWLNRRVTDGHYEIMTEAQWHNFATYNDLDKEVWYQSNSEDKTHEVMSKLSNKNGIYSSYGNVAEMVRSKNGYVAVGGSWKSSKSELDKKYKITQNQKENWLGLRLVKIKNKKDKK